MATRVRINFTTSCGMGLGLWLRLGLLLEIGLKPMAVFRNFHFPHYTHTWSAQQ